MTTRIANFLSLIPALLSMEPFASKALAASQPLYDPTQLNSVIVDKFLDFVNEPSTQVSELIAEFKKKHTDSMNPEGGIRTPITRAQLTVVPLFREEISEKFCDPNNICTTRSLKSEVLITLPVRICRIGACVDEALVFTMMGGFKTVCKDQECKDSSVFFVPADVDIVVRQH